MINDISVTSALDKLFIDDLCIATLRTLAMDAVQQADSGHPGTPMALAPAAYALWQGQLRHNPENAGWFDRDRFVLSAGHLRLGKLICLYDTNHISIDGDTEITLSDDVVRRFEGYGGQALNLGEKAGASLGWCEWVGGSGDVIAVDHFGASAPGEVLMDAFGFNVDNLVARACALCGHD